MAPPERRRASRWTRGLAEDARGEPVRTPLRLRMEPDLTLPPLPPPAPTGAFWYFFSPRCLKACWVKVPASPKVKPTNGMSGMGNACVSSKAPVGRLAGGMVGDVCVFGGPRAGGRPVARFANALGAHGCGGYTGRRMSIRTGSKKETTRGMPQTSEVRILLAVSALVLCVSFAPGPARSEEQAPVVPAVAARADFYVAPTGHDTDPGTLEKPFATPAKARDAVRRKKEGGMPADLIVFLREGSYELAEPLTFGAEDGGTEQHHVVFAAYPGEKPVLSGGRKITGWKTEAEGRWTATTALDHFRQLYLNGTRAPRARGGKLPGARLFGDTGKMDGVAGFTTTDTAMAGWRNPGDIELGFFNSWSHMIGKVERIEKDGGSTRLVMQQPCFFFLLKKEGVQAGLPDYVENALELLKKPGQWYLDRLAHTVYYLPRDGEDMQAADIVAPVLEMLLRVTGTLDRPVRSLCFRGLTFAHANWLRPSLIGHPDVQANFITQKGDLFQRDEWTVMVQNEFIKSPGCVVLDAAKSVRFERCTFTKLGGAGVDIQRGSQDNLIVGCHFYDISGSAIQVGDVLRDDHHPADQRLVVKNNRVENNYIHRIGVEYQDSIGVFAGYTEGTVIAHNEVAELPYSGISVGWGWGEPDEGGGAYKQPFLFKTLTTACSNLVEFNHIHHVMQSRHDGGGIYTLSRQPGTVIRKNLIHDNPGAPGGIYLDEGSAEIEVTGNAVYNVRTPMNYNNNAQGRRKTCREHDNTFNVKPGAPSFSEALATEAGLEAAYRDIKGP